MNIYPNNMTAQYVTKLPTRIELNGDWSILLKEISTPLTFDNIPSDYYTFTVKENKNETKIHMELAMQNGKYAVIDELNRLVNQYDMNFQLKLNDQNHTRVRSLVGGKYIFRPGEALSYLIGMGLEEVRDFTRGMYMATGPMKIPAVQIPNLYVYCNILQHVIVGDATAPLLRIVNGGQDKIITKKTRMHVFLSTSIFVPVQRKSFDTIEIFILTNTGKPVPFNNIGGKSYVVIEFKKSGLLNIL